MRTYRNAHILQDAVVLFDRGVIDWNARIVDRFVHYARRGGLRSPSKIIHCFRPVALAGGVDLVDRDHLALALMQKASPGYCGLAQGRGATSIMRNSITSPS